MERALVDPPEATASTLRKQERLKALLAEMGSVVVAFSGGVDSAFLAVVAHQVLGERALAVTGESPSYPAHQRGLALDVVRRFSLGHRFIPTSEIENEAYRANGPDRCFHCKNELYSKLRRLADEDGFACLADGANADDRKDYRPGRKAAAQWKVRSPLEEVGLTKNEIRSMSARLGLPTANEPASACLSSRVPYHRPITIETLSQVERGEEILRRQGFRQMRVRHHGELVRLEFAREELPRALEEAMRQELTRSFKELGYRYVTIDLEGYRTGSLNEALPGRGSAP